MTVRRVTRGNTVTFAFTFYDEDGNLASVSSATLQLTYPGKLYEVTEALTLTEGDDDAWEATWDSSKSQPGWVKYHAHGIAGSYQYAEDGRFPLRGNAANIDHDALPDSGTPSTTASYRPSDYGS